MFIELNIKQKMNRPLPPLLINEKYYKILFILISKNIFKIKKRRGIAPAALSYSVIVFVRSFSSR